jgi:hypothetical protein
MKKIPGLPLAIILLTFGGIPFQSAVAQDASAGAVAPRSNPSAHPVDQAIPHVSGGVDLDERAELEALSSQYNKTIRVDASRQSRLAFYWR